MVWIYLNYCKKIFKLVVFIFVVCSEELEIDLIVLSSPFNLSFTHICHVFFFRPPFVIFLLFGVELKPKACFYHYLNIFYNLYIYDAKINLCHVCSPCSLRNNCDNAYLLMTKHKLLISCDCHWHFSLFILMDQSSISHFYRWSMSAVVRKLQCSDEVTLVS